MDRNVKKGTLERDRIAAKQGCSIKSAAGCATFPTRPRCRRRVARNACVCARWLHVCERSCLTPFSNFGQIQKLRGPPTNKNKLNIPFFGHCKQTSKQGFDFGFVACVKSKTCHQPYCEGELLLRQCKASVAKPASCSVFSKSIRLFQIGV